MTKESRSKPLIVGGLALVLAGLGGTFVWAFHTAGVFKLPGQSTPAQAPIVVVSPSISPPVEATPIEVFYLAVKPGSPNPEDSVPVGDLATMQSLIVAGRSNDETKYGAIATSPEVSLIRGGAMVDVVSTSGEFSQVKLRSLDLKGNDLSGQTRWVWNGFIQTTQIQS